MSWNEELNRTSDCIAIDRLGEPLTAREQRHLDRCARCQSEMALFREFDAGEVRPEDEADVQAIVEQLRRPSVVAIGSRRRSSSRTLAAAAMLVIAIGLAYMFTNREPSVNVPLGGESAYRSAAVEVVAPKGDVASAPAELRWNAIAGARQYDVAVFEVDRTMLWQSTTSDTSVALPASVAERCVPGKTILWQVTAKRDSSVIAQSGLQRFRVRTQ